jgi:acetyltransferase-like isoleucine patch superfamily enzyme
MSLIDWARARQTPAQRAAYKTLQSLAGARAPVIPGVHHALLAGRRLRHSYWRHFKAKVYHEPLLRLSCEQVGERLHLYENQPKIIGPLRARLGHNVGLEGEQVWIAAGDTRPKHLVIGDDSYVGHACILIAGTEVLIGRHVLIANNVLLNGYDGHPLDPLARAAHQPPGPEGAGPIHIGDYAWIGNRAVILKGVHVGRGAVIATGAVVTHDVPELAVVAGVPARVVRQLPAPEGWATA